MVKAGAKFWIEVGFATITGAVFVVTLITREWIEALFNVDPDGGDGSLEWAIVATLLMASITLSLLARAEWHKTGKVEGG